MVSTPGRWEYLLAGVTALHLSLLPWAFGGMPAWSQAGSLGLAAVGFMLALQVRRVASAPPATASTALRAFPIFWAGLALLAYLLVQACNPAWRFVSSPGHWWLEPVRHVTWLPHGVDAPFDRSNPWRALVIVGALWLLVCSVWTGFLHRRSYHALFAVLVGNAFLLALLGLVQQLTGATRIFWNYTPSNPSFVATFIYRNHAGAYFNLMVAVATGLACWHDRRARRRQLRSSPAGVLAFIAVALGLTVIFASSRMSILLLLAFVGGIGGSRLFRFFRTAGARPRRRGALALGIVLAGFTAGGLASLRVETVWRRFAELAAHPTAATQDRTQARAAATDMLRADWLLGWGAGCFRHGFPLYAQNYPAIYSSPGHERAFWEHAHSDLLEFPIEYGLLGLLPWLVALGGAAWRLVRQAVWRDPVAFPLALACGLLLLHAAVDFVFQNPAVLLTAAVLLTGASRWPDFAADADRGRSDLRSSYAPPPALNPRTACTPAPGASLPA